MTKKVIVFIMSCFLFVGGLVFTGQNDVAESAVAKPPSGGTKGDSGWRKSCKQTNTGKVCTQYKDYYISAYWTKKEVKSIYRKYSVLGHPMTQVLNTAGASALTVSKLPNTIKKARPFGVVSALHALGAGASIGRFEAAYHKGRALRIDYTYRITKNSNKGTYRNIKTNYVK